MDQKVERNPQNRKAGMLALACWLAGNHCNVSQALEVKTQIRTRIIAGNLATALALITTLVAADDE